MPKYIVEKQFVKTCGVSRYVVIDSVTLIPETNGVGSRMEAERMAKDMNAGKIYDVNKEGDKGATYREHIEKYKRDSRY